MILRTYEVWMANEDREDAQTVTAPDHFDAVREATLRDDFEDDGAILVDGNFWEVWVCRHGEPAADACLVRVDVCVPPPQIYTTVIKAPKHG